MSAESALYALLTNDAPVVALVSKRVAIDRMEQGAVFPFVVFARTNSVPQTTLAGPVLATLVSLDVQCWAEKFSSAEAVADAVTAAVRAAVPHQVTGRAGGYDADTDRAVVSLSVDWWDIP